MADVKLNMKNQQDYHIKQDVSKLRAETREQKIISLCSGADLNLFI